MRENKKPAALIAIIMIMTIAAMMSGCGRLSGGNSGFSVDGNLMKGAEAKPPLSSEEIQEGLANGMGDRYCDFAVELFKVSALGTKATAPENSLVSPLSVIYAMGMVANGAEAESRRELVDVLVTGHHEQSGEVEGADAGGEVEGIDAGGEVEGTDAGGEVEGAGYDELQEKLNVYLRAYNNRIRERYDYEKEMLELYTDRKIKPTELRIANSIWMKKDPELVVVPDFIDTNATYYEAGLAEIEFNSKAKDKINKWIEERTGGTIKDMLKEVSESAIMYLVNALAFEGTWLETYTQEQVHEGTFHGEKGDSEVECMYSEEAVYLHDENTTGLIKAYQGNSYAFVALLPDEGFTMDEYIASLTGEKIKNLLDTQEYCTVNAMIPKYEAESTLSLVEAFKSMGVEESFDLNKANFSRLGSYKDQNIFIGNILHNTYIKVDELGTKAGAATIVEMLAEGAMVDEEPKNVYLDRPFVYMLIDTEEKMPLFIGVIRDI